MEIVVSCLRITWINALRGVSSKKLVALALVEGAFIKAFQSIGRHIEGEQLIWTCPILLILSCGFGLYCNSNTVINTRVLKSNGFKENFSIAVASVTFMGSPKGIIWFFPCWFYFQNLSLVPRTFVTFLIYTICCLGNQAVFRSQINIQRVSRIFRIVSLRKRIATEVIRWNALGMLTSRAYRYSFLEILAYAAGLYYVEIKIGISLSTSILIAAVMVCLLLGAMVHSCLGQQGPALWVDISYGAPSSLQRWGSLFPAATAGLSLVLVVSLTMPYRFYYAAGLGILALGSSIGTAQIISIIFPYRITRDRPVMRAGSSVVYIAFVQISVLVLSLLPVMAVIYSFNSPEKILFFGVLIGTTVSAVGTIIAGFLYARNPQRVLKLMINKEGA